MYNPVCLLFVTGHGGRAPYGDLMNSVLAQFSGAGTTVHFLGATQVAGQLPTSADQDIISIAMQTCEERGLAFSSHAVEYTLHKDGPNAVGLIAIDAAGAETSKLRAVLIPPTSTNRIKGDTEKATTGSTVAPVCRVVSGDVASRIAQESLISSKGVAVMIDFESGGGRVPEVADVKLSSPITIAGVLTCPCTAPISFSEPFYGGTSGGEIRCMSCSRGFAVVSAYQRRTNGTTDYGAFLMVFEPNQPAGITLRVDSIEFTTPDGVGVRLLKAVGDGLDSFGGDFYTTSSNADQCRKDYQSRKTHSAPSTSEPSGGMTFGGLRKLKLSEFNAILEEVDATREAIVVHSFPKEDDAIDQALTELAEKARLAETRLADLPATVDAITSTLLGVDAAEYERELRARIGYSEGRLYAALAEHVDRVDVVRASRWRHQSIAPLLRFLAESQKQAAEQRMSSWARPMRFERLNLPKAGPCYLMLALAYEKEDRAKDARHVLRASLGTDEPSFHEAAKARLNYIDSIFRVRWWELRKRKSK